MEMHTVHLPAEAKSGVIAAAMGIIFSVDDYTAKLTNKQRHVIDEFFDSIQMDANTGSYKVDEVKYGDLMMMVDMNNRWTYKGSVTTPPCATYVYWNVVREVYPVSARHY